MVGSEGTLAFLAGVTMKTEYDYPYKASAMLYFSDIKEACRAVVAMKRLVNANGEWIVKGAELLDWKSLASVNDPTGEGLTAVLTETKACTQEELNQNIAIIEEALKHSIHIFRSILRINSKNIQNTGQFGQVFFHL